MSTPHISADKSQVAKNVIMPGDPLRAKYISTNYLTDCELINNVRGMFAYTGKYKGSPVTVMGHGMGMPSMGIYSFELFNFYDVDTIIRIGSAGAIAEDVKVNDIVFALGACTNSNYANQYRLSGTFAPIADFSLLEKAVLIARDNSVKIKIGNVLTSDTFYDDSNSSLEWDKMGVLAVEMEAAALYMNAARARKSALCILTISDELRTGIELTSEERQNTFNEMIEIALDTAIK